MKITLIWLKTIIWKLLQSNSAGVSSSCWVSVCENYMIFRAIILHATCTCMHAHMQMHTYTSVSTWTYARSKRCISMHTCTHECAHMCTCAHVRMCMHTHTHTHMYRHTHTLTIFFLMALKKKTVVKRRGMKIENGPFMASPGSY